MSPFAKKWQFPRLRHDAFFCADDLPKYSSSMMPMMTCLQGPEPVPRRHIPDPIVQAIVLPLVIFNAPSGIRRLRREVLRFAPGIGDHEPGDLVDVERIVELDAVVVRSWMSWPPCRGSVSFMQSCL